VSRALEEFLSDPSAAEKELTRKLYWSITSTLSLTPAQKKSTFSWVADFAEKVVSRHSVPPPPASRPETRGSQKLASSRRNGYAALAGGGAAGRLDRGGRRPLPSKRTASKPTHPPETDPARLAAWAAAQASMRTRARKYMIAENVRLGITQRRPGRYF